MIETQTLKGREAYVVYLDNQLQPVDKGDETLVKIIYKDNGETLWLVVPQDDEE